MNKIGIWNTAFLGDAILTLPLVQTLRASYPGAEIHFWVRKGYGPLFSAQPGIDRVFEFDKRGEQQAVGAMRSLGARLAGMGYTLWISAHASFRSALIARWCSARVRIGYASPWYNRWFYTHTVNRGFGEVHEVDRLLRLAEPLGVSRLSTWPELALPPEALEKAEALAREWGDGPVIGVHPGSVWPTKRWPASSYGRLISIAASRGVKSVVFGGPGEEAEAREVLETAGQESGSVFDLSGKLSLTELAAVILKLDCYVTNDSGPMHMAWAQRVPVVAMFGPTVEEWGFFPRGAHSRVLQRSMPCRPCGLHGGETCPEGHHDCMKGITPEAAWEVVADRLGSKLSGHAEKVAASVRDAGHDGDESGGGDAAVSGDLTDGGRA